MFKDNKRGQVALFVIIALVIVGVLLLIFLFPKSKLGADIDENPIGYLRSCIEPGIKPEISKITAQGGFSNPEGFILYNGVKVKYLCYTSEDYKTCVNQVPLIVGQVEKEISSIVEKNTQRCLDQMKTDYQKRGMSVSTGNVKTNTSINTNGINIVIESPITITKENTQTYRNFEVTIPSNLYTLLMTSTSIIEFESVYGDAETTLYLQYYPNLKIRKNALSDGTTIYNVRDYITNESFTFASRSVAWPSGYGIE
jgi:hypothetical protein